MLEYKTVRSSDHNQFDEDVNTHLRLGYTLQGGVSITAISDVRNGMTCLLAQAVVRTVADPVEAINAFNSKQCVPVIQTDVTAQQLT